MNNKKATLFIFIVPIVWGLGFTLTHNAVIVVNPGLFTFYRQLTASICLLPFALPYFKQINRQVLFWAFTLGLLTLSSVLCQAFALMTLSSAQIAFFVTLNILFVPFLAGLFQVAKLKLIDMGAVVIGIISVLITFGGTLGNFGVGGLLGLGASLSIALSIVTVSIMVKKCSANRMLLTFLSIAFGAILLIPFPIYYTIPDQINHSSIWSTILFQGCISTAVAYFIQMKFQRDVGTTKTALILNLDLFFAGIFGLINGEALSTAQIIGGCVAFIASVFPDIVEILKKYIKRSAD